MRRLTILILALYEAAAAWAVPVTIEWEALPEASSYEFQIVSSTKTVLTIETRELVWKTELPEGIYRYRTRAIDSSGNRGNWSTLQRIEVRPRKRLKPLYLELATFVSIDRLGAFDSSNQSSATFYADPGAGARLGVEIFPLEETGFAVVGEAGIKTLTIKGNAERVFGGTSNLLCEVSAEGRYYFSRDGGAIGVGLRFRQEPFAWAPGPRSLTFNRIGGLSPYLSGKAFLLVREALSSWVIARVGWQLGSGNEDEIYVTRGVLAALEIWGAFPMGQSIEFLAAIGVGGAWFTTSLGDERHTNAVAWLGLRL